MGETIIFDPADEFAIRAPDVSHLVTEDDTPVDNLFSERQMALLRETLYTSWEGPGDGRPFAAMGNVAIYVTNFHPPLVPDLLLSLDITLPENVRLKEHRCYYLWLYGKPPEVVIEIVSNQKGGEMGNKLLDYARMGVSYYVVYDPDAYLSEQSLRVFARQGTNFMETAERWLAGVGLELTLWWGVYDGLEANWLRWIDRNGVMLATGAEAKHAERQRADQAQLQAEQAQLQAEQAQLQAEQAQLQAEQAQLQAEQERQRAEALAAKLRELGIDPQSIAGG
jgi:hypothetical protein